MKSVKEELVNQAWVCSMMPLLYDVHVTVKKQAEAS